MSASVSAPTLSPAEALSRIGALTRRYADILSERPVSADPPSWITARGWGPWLLDLTEAQVAAAEARGPWQTLARCPGAPSDLVALCEAGAAAFDRWGLSAEESSAPAPKLLGAAPHKAAQVMSLVRALGGWPVRRVVDIGAGHGHLTRALAQAFGRPALGLEYHAERVERANHFAARDGVDAHFVALDALSDPWPLAPGDLVVGLHACGRLGDAAAQAVAQSEGAALALVGCCLQKMHHGERAPISEAGRQAGVIFDTATLSFGNYAPPTPVAHRARARRQALAVLLRGRGVAADVVSAPRGQPKRRFDSDEGFAVAARAALAAHDLPAPTEAEIEGALAAGRRDHEILRRWSLPRLGFTGLVEGAVALDRAAALVEGGLSVSIQAAFPASASPRNVLISARRTP